MAQSKKVDLAIRNGGWNQVSQHQLNLVGGLEHEIYFSIYLECHNPERLKPPTRITWEFVDHME